MNDCSKIQNPALSKYTVSFGLALAVASVVNGLLVVAKEKSPAVMAAMKRLTGHHWITHSAIVVALFFVLGLVFARTNDEHASQPAAVNRLIRILAGGVILGAVIIAGFYLIGD